MLFIADPETDFPSDATLARLFDEAEPLTVRPPEVAKLPLVALVAEVESDLPEVAALTLECEAADPVTERVPRDTDPEASVPVEFVEAALADFPAIVPLALVAPDAAPSAFADVWARTGAAAIATRAVVTIRNFLFMSFSLSAR